MLDITNVIILVQGEAKKKGKAANFCLRDCSILLVNHESSIYTVVLWKESGGRQYVQTRTYATFYYN